MLEMSVENIRRVMRDGICFEKRLSEWGKNKWSTNCYAFALGLNVDEDDICPYAYRIGNISLQAKWPFISVDPSNKISAIEPLILDDFQALGIDYEIFMDKDESQYLQELDHPNDCWDILLFISPSDGYHFVRVGSDSLLYHKLGWGKLPELTDFEDIKREYKGCKFERRYRLSLDSRNNAR